MNNNNRKQTAEIKEIKDFLNREKPILEKLTAFMLAYNAHTNLTRITEPDEIIEKHFIDSVLPLTLYNVPRGTSALDVGSGAGYPGVMMKLFRPDLEFALLDSAKKRTDYLRALLEEIGISCAVVTGRSEILAHKPIFREKYGLVTARAVANLAALCEYCLPFVKSGGVFLAMKGDISGKAERDSLESAKKAVRVLGGEVARVIEYKLPCGDSRNLVVINKIKETPCEYPRRRVNITRNPIGHL
jgi:16S rRNA (guanine(527)-N(7))-methyltransferase RsmG